MPIVGPPALKSSQPFFSTSLRGAGLSGRLAFLAISALFMASGEAARAQTACPPAAAAAADSGWKLLRSNSLAQSRTMFTRALQSCATAVDAQLGLAFVRFRSNEIDGADSLFRSVARRDTTHADAWEGIAMVEERRGQTTAAIAATRRVLALAPNYESAAARLKRLAPDDDRPPINRAARRNAVISGDILF
jgi:Tfp pilus assembly protein PilF